MPKDHPRHTRIAGQIQRELTGLIRNDLKDPRLNPLLTLTEVRVSHDLRHARIYVGALGDDDSQSNITLLNKASGLLRGKLGRLLHIRAVPELHFIHDDTLANANRIDALIQQAVSNDHNSNPSE